MSAVKRRINSTGRKRIDRDRIDIRMGTPVPGEALGATASIRLDGLGFPGSASVALDAYHRSTGMRFDCGTVADLRIPAPLKLNDIDPGGAVLFRLKVIDRDTTPGKLLGSAERISPREADNPDGKRNIFPVIQRDLGQEAWRVAIEDDTRPTLILNNRIPGVVRRILDDPLARAILLPAALRIVLESLTEPEADETEEMDWKAEWIEYIRVNFALELDSKDRMAWIETVVERFCEHHDFIREITKAIEGETSAY